MTKPAQRQPERVSGVKQRKGCGLDVDDFQRQGRRLAFDDAIAHEHGLAKSGFAAGVDEAATRQGDHDAASADLDHDAGLQRRLG